MNETYLLEQRHKVTQDLLKNSGTVRYIKVRTLGHIEKVTKDQAELLSSLGWDIINHGIEVETVNTEILMMALMAVNHIAKYDKINRKVLNCKNELQGVLLLRKDVSKRQGENYYSKTIELIHGIWSTHIPLSVLPRVLHHK